MAQRPTPSSSFRPNAAVDILLRASDQVCRVAHARTRKLYDRFFARDLSDASFLSRAFRNGFSDAGALARHVTSRSSPNPLIMRSDAEDFSIEDRDQLIILADRVCRHRFDLLGSGEVFLGDHIDWHRDFKAGYRWDPLNHFTDIKIPYSQADIKVPWELSRFSHAVTLGQAYLLTGDQRFAAELTAQIDHWIDQNRPTFGVNWACPMDIAIRACNWITGFLLIQGSPAITEAFLLRLLKSLYQHGTHIRRNLERGRYYAGNHYLANLAGLIYISVFLPELRDADAWRSFGIDQMRTEMGRQVYADGCNFEGSTCYHRLALELFFYPTLFLVINHSLFTGNNHVEVTDRLFGADFTASLRRMFHAVLSLLQPSGTMPQIGDNDNGQLHILAQRCVLDMRYLLSLGAIFFKDDDLKITDHPLATEARWVFGRPGIASWSALKGRRSTDLESHAFPYAGWYVIRQDRDHLVISCGQNGQNGIGGHAHNDKLSFTLCYNGIDVIVDPGTYLYTSDPLARNLFRSTGYHNTVAVSELEQNGFSAGARGLFRMSDDSRAQSLEWVQDALSVRFAGIHYGFSPKEVLHSRSIEFQKGSRQIVITDHLSSQSVGGTAYLHLAPQIEVVRNGAAFDAGPARLSFGGAERVAVEQYRYSPHYGSTLEASRIRVDFFGDLTTHISPSAAGRDGTR